MDIGARTPSPREDERQGIAQDLENGRRRAVAGDGGNDRHRCGRWGVTTAGNQQAHYCKKVDAYRLKTCAKAILPATLTEAEVRAQFSAAYFAVWGDQQSPAVLVTAARS